MRGASNPDQSMISVYFGDITQVGADVVVNLANEENAHIGGIAAVIAKACPHYAAWSQKADNCVKTGAANYYASDGGEAWNGVITTVGPRWSPDKPADAQHGNENKLRSAYKAVFEVFHGIRVRTIAIAPISVGIFGCPPLISIKMLCGFAVSSIKTNMIGQHIKIVTNVKEHYELVQETIAKYIVDTKNISASLGYGMFASLIEDGKEEEDKEDEQKDEPESSVDFSKNYRHKDTKGKRIPYITPENLDCETAHFTDVNGREIPSTIRLKHVGKVYLTIKGNDMNANHLELSAF